MAKEELPKPGEYDLEEKILEHMNEDYKYKMFTELRKMKREGRFNTYKLLEDAVKQNTTEEEYRKFTESGPEDADLSMPYEKLKNWEKWQRKIKREIRESIASRRVGEIRDEGRAQSGNFPKNFTS